MIHLNNVHVSKNRFVLPLFSSLSNHFGTVTDDEMQAKQKAAGDDEAQGIDETFIDA